MYRRIPFSLKFLQQPVLHSALVLVLLIAIPTVIRIDVVQSKQVHHTVLFICHSGIETGISC